MTFLELSLHFGWIQVSVGYLIKKKNKKKENP